MSEYQYQINQFDDLIGKDILIPPNSFLDRVIKTKYLANLILYGPSGCGKTTILDLLVKYLNVNALFFNPLIDKKDKLVNFIASESILPKVVVINEIHNMNKDKQDILLEALQNKVVYLFASTNINPFFNLNNALISRSFLLKLNQLDATVLAQGMLKLTTSMHLKHNYEEIIKYITQVIGNDIRKCLSTLFMLINLYDDVLTWNLNDLKTIIDNNATFVSTSSDHFTDLKSAFHKSLRGSDPNAALYYLNLLMKSGDYQAIYRRLICAAYEDVGLANPSLPSQVVSAVQACEYLGEAESNDVLSFITVSIALSPKSNSAYMAFMHAKEALDKYGEQEVPTYLKNGSLKYNNINTKHQKQTYLYPHNFKFHWVNQQYLPDKLKDLIFYEPNLDASYEAKLEQYWEQIKKGKE